MSTWQMLGYLIILSLIVIAWLIIFLFIVRNSRKKAAMAALEDVPTDHMSLYIDEFFPTMIKNFDIVTKPRFKEWSDLVDGRLVKVSEHISSIKSLRKKIDQRLGKVEGRIEKLEST